MYKRQEQTSKYYDYIFPSISNKLEVIEKDKKGVIDKDDNIFFPLIFSNLFVLKDNTLASPQTLKLVGSPGC